jgi:hypothetical protein
LHKEEDRSAFSLIIINLSSESENFDKIPEKISEDVAIFEKLALIIVNPHHAKE